MKTMTQNRIQTLTLLQSTWLFDSRIVRVKPSHILKVWFLAGNFKSKRKLVIRNVSPEAVDEDGVLINGKVAKKKLIVEKD